MLEVRNINSYYEDLHVLRDVTLKVNEGEIVALLGPNGHGKSTLLKAISGIHSPRSGSLSFGMKDISKLPAHRIVELGIAYIPESRDLFPEMTVEENLLMGAYILRDKAKIKENLEMAYDLFPRLKERRKQECQTLSGGEGRMVAIGRGLMSSGTMLLVDEPSIGLSPSMRKIVFEALERINKEQNMTILIVEQEIGNILSLAGRVYLLKNGQILFEKPISEVDISMIKDAYF